jgi:hypothetical protein
MHALAAVHDAAVQMIGTDAEKRLRGAIKAGSRVEYEAMSPILARWLWVRICPMLAGPWPPVLPVKTLGTNPFG